MSAAAVAVPERAPVTTPGRSYRLAAVAMLAACFFWTAWKALTSSLTVDETFTWKYWIDAPLSNFFTFFEPNNHPLNTVLTILSSTILGDSEAGLRLPSVLGGLLYFWSCYRLTLLLFGSSLRMLVTLALLCGNPLVLDHFATSRGYGLGIAFWTLGAYLVVDAIRSNGDRRLSWWAGVALGLSACAYLTQMYPVVALAFVTLVFFGVRTVVDRSYAADLRSVYLPLLFPLFAAILFVRWFMTHTTLKDYHGEPNIRPAITGFLNAMLNSGPVSWNQNETIWRLTHVIPWILLLVLLGGITLTAGWLTGRWWRLKNASRLPFSDRQMLLLAGTLALLILELFFEPRLRHHVFFTGRRLLCIWPPLVLTAMAWLDWMRRWGLAGRLISGIGFVLSVMVVAHTSFQFRPESFFQWEFDAGTKHAVQVISSRPGAGGKLSIASSDMIDQTLEYYLRKANIQFDKIDKDLDSGHDYFLVRDGDWSRLERFDPQVLYRNAAAGTRLVVAGPTYHQALSRVRDLGFEDKPGRSVDPINVDSWAEMTRPGVNKHFLRDVMEGQESEPQRWTFARPAYLFRAPATRPLKLILHVRLPLVTFREIGPVTMTVWVNGKRLDQERYTTPEDHIFEREVPANFLRPDGMTMVETTLDRYWIAPSDNAKLGYLFVAGGFR